MFVALIAATAFAYLAQRFRRQQLTFILSAVILGGFTMYSFLVDAPGDGTGWTFYFFGDLYSTLMVATFFAFLNNSVRSDTARRLYGLIGLGGVAGGAFGTTVLKAKLNDFTLSEWLWICFAIGMVIVAVAAYAGRLFTKSTPLEVAETKHEPAVGGNPAWEGAKAVMGSRYLLAIVAIVGFYEMVSTVMDFQFTATAVHYMSGDAIGAHFATVYAIPNWVALFVQLFLTSFIMTRFGVGAALLVLPAAALCGPVGFLAVPALWVGSALNTTDNGFRYSINQSAKEVLYVPTTRLEKYQAKAFIDMFVQRFAKAVAVGLNLEITTLVAGFAGVRWLSLLTVLILVAWLQVARYAGREFKRLSEEQEEIVPDKEPAAA